MRRDKRRVVLLLTACVRPNCDHDGWSEYTDLRRREYLRACLHHLPRKIAFDLGILPRTATMKAMTVIPDLPDELQ